MISVLGFIISGLVGIMAVITSDGVIKYLMKKFKKVFFLHELSYNIICKIWLLDYRSIRLFVRVQFNDTLDYFIQVLILVAIHEALCIKISTDERVAPMNRYTIREHGVCKFL